MLVLARSLACLILSVCLSTMLSAQTLTKIGEWTEGTTEALAESDDVVYYANGTWIESVSIADPARPVKLDRINMREGTQRLISNGDVLYVTQGRRVVLLEITDPQNLFPVDTLLFSYSRLFLHDNQLIGGRNERVDIFDVSDPFEPAEPLQIDVPVNVNWIEVSGSNMYVATYQDELYCYNIDDPSNPVLLTTITRSRINSVAVNGDRMYVTGDSLYVFDIQDPASPTQIYALDGYRRNMAFQGDVLFTFDLNARLEAYDISDPDLLVELGEYEPEISGNASFGGHGSAAFKDGFVVLADAEYGIYLVSTIDPANMTTLASVAAGGYHNFVEVTGDQLLISSNAVGMTVLDVSDPTTPVFEQQLVDVGSPVQTDVAGDVAYVAGRPAAVLQRADGDWSVVRQLERSYAKVDVVGDKAYFMNGEVTVFDLTDPTDPVEIGQFGDFRSARAILALGDTVFVYDSNEGLYAFDASDPSNVTEITFIDMPGYGWRLIPDQDTLIVARLTADVHLLDLTNLELGEATVVPSTYGFRDFVRVSGTLIGLNSWGMWWFNGHGADMTGEFLAPVPGNCRNLASNGNIIYALSSDEGVHVFRWEGVETNAEIAGKVEAVVDVNVFPNPFGSNTTIQYRGASEKAFGISVYDVLGRVVRTLVESEYRYGDIHVEWDGRGNAGERLAPGIYYLRIEGESFSLTRKLVKLQ